MAVRKFARRNCRAVLEHIKRATVFSLIFATVYSAMYGCKDIVHNIICAIMGINGDIPGLSLRAYTLIILIAAILVSGLVVYLIFYQHAKRDYRYLVDTMKTDDERAPAADMDDLVQKICGESSRNIRLLIEVILRKQIKATTSLLLKPLKYCKVIIIGGAWGVGKTTTLLLAIEKASRAGNRRYIYESAFTYANDLTGMENGILDELNDILEERGLYPGHEAKNIAKSLNGNNVSDLLLIAGIKQKGNITSSSIKKLNDIYNDLSDKKKFEIDIIVDDIDRLPAKDIIEAISFVSLLNRLKFVRLILPLDTEAISEQLKVSIYKPETYLHKYLPSQNTVEIKSSYAIATQIAEQKMRKLGKRTKNIAFSPAWSAVLYKVIDKKVKKEAKKWARDYRWTNLYAAPRAESNNLIAAALKRQTGELKSTYASTPHYLKNISDGRNFTTFITQPTMNDEAKTKIKDVFSDKYYDLFAGWVPNFASRYWQQFEITMRDITDVLSELKGLSLTGKESDAELFAKTFNHLYKSDVIRLKK